MTMGKAAAIRSSYISASLFLFFTGCGRYADFTLPVLPPARPPHLSLHMQPDPILTRGPAGAWDSGDVLNPSVVRYNGVYFNFYSGFDGKTWHTGLARSDDGIHWTKLGKVLSPDPKTWEGSYIAANGSALLVDDEFWYWYQSGPRNSPRIALARSTNGRNWRKEPAPVLGFGPLGSWDERAAADPFVLKIGDWFYLYYLGQDRARLQQLGLARSRDGIRWQKLRSSPIMEIPLPGFHATDENGLGEPAVWQKSGLYWMLFTGRDAQENRSLGLAHSRDGVHWIREPEVFHGASSWNRKVLCDPAVQNEPNRIRFWFGGGDQASPDENLHGQIGVGEITP